MDLSIFVPYMGAIWGKSGDIGSIFMKNRDTVFLRFLSKLFDCGYILGHNCVRSEGETRSFFLGGFGPFVAKNGSIIETSESTV